MYRIGISAADTPDLQQYGENLAEYWQQNDWVQYFFALKNQLGIEAAKQKFVEEWNKNEPFSMAITFWGRGKKLTDIPQVLSYYGVFFNNGYASVTPAIQTDNAATQQQATQSYTPFIIGGVLLAAYFLLKE